MLFQYRYIDSKGRKRKGLIDAVHFEDAKEKLRAQKILLTSLVSTTSQKKKGHQIGKQALINFTTQLYSLLKAGLPLYESLLSLEEQYRQDSFHPILLSLCSQIKEGGSLSEAMGLYPDSFNRLYCSMVAAGESVGSLDLTLEKLSTLLNKQSKLKKQIITALIYPALLLAFSGVVMLLLLTFVIPSLEMLFEDRQVNRFTGLVMHFSRFLTHKWPYYLPLMVGTGLGSYLALTSAKGKRWVQRNLLRLPFLKTLITQTAIARFARTMGTLLQGGVSLIQALQISRKVMRNPFFEEVIEKAETKIIEGSLLSLELKKSPLIPTLVPRMLAIGEEGGNAQDMLQKIADLYEDEVEKSLTRLTALAQPVILVLMGGIVGLIMIAVLLPLTDVSAFL
ncbi:MAG: Type II secretion system protein F [Chlamydiales bacterium]|nr:Type II secretion system protein F [Chlamydiales bacterium]